MRNHGRSTVFLNGERFAQGRIELAAIVGEIDKCAAAKDIPELKADAVLQRKRKSLPC